MAELHNRLALTPDRMPDPPLPVTIVPPLASTRRILGLVVVMIVGFAGYRWGSAPPPTPSQRQDTVLSHPEDVAPERPVSAVHLDTPSLDPKPLELQLVANAPAPRVVLDQARGATDGAILVSAQREPVASPTPAQPASASSAAPKASAPIPDEQKSRDSYTYALVDRRSAQFEWSGNVAFASTKSQPRRLEAVEIALMVRNGTAFMVNGNVGAARMMFQPAADAGDPVAALALAETYDPVVLRKLGAKGGITPDVPTAHSWYEKAKDLGSPVASERLERLAKLSE